MFRSNLLLLSYIAQAQDTEYTCMSSVERVNAGPFYLYDHMPTEKWTDPDFYNEA